MNAMNRTHATRHRLALGVFAALLLPASSLFAQDSGQATDPHRHHDTPSSTGQDAAEPMQGMDHSTMDHSRMDHSKMEHMAEGHAGMQHDLSSMPGGHRRMDHAAHAPNQPRTPVPPLTDSDRAAATPPVHGHPSGDNRVHGFMLIDGLEAWDSDEGTAWSWSGRGWIGTDLDRLWLRSSGESVSGHSETAELELLYGRSFSPWWDVVAGLRRDFAPGDGDAQDFVAIGLQGLAPQKFEVEATAYLGEHGQGAIRLETGYEVLLTNRLVLQPRLELEAFGKDDPARGIGSGLGTAEIGLRLRYEFTRKFAPYVGVVHERAFDGTADLRRDSSQPVDDTRIVVGVRTWF